VCRQDEVVLRSFGISPQASSELNEGLVYRIYLAPNGGQMPKSVTSPLQKKLVALLVEQRNKAGLRQVNLAKKMKTSP
jgi:hypothetical protein